MSLIKKSNIESIGTLSSITIYELDADKLLGGFEIRYCLFTADKTNIRSGTATITAALNGPPNLPVDDSTSSEIGDTANVTLGAFRADHNVTLFFDNRDASDYYVQYEIYSIEVSRNIINNGPLLQMTITGMPDGFTWKGLSNGVHIMKATSYSRAPGNATVTNSSTTGVGPNRIQYKQTIENQGGLGSESWVNIKAGPGTANAWEGSFKIVGGGGNFKQYRRWTVNTYYQYTTSKSSYFTGYHKDIFIMNGSDGSTYTRGSNYLYSINMPVTGDAPCPSLRYLRSNALSNTTNLYIGGQPVRFTWQILHGQPKGSFGNF